jgi:Flp pilus assembly protein TadG
MNPRRRTWTEQGQTLVEVAIVLPVLLLVLFAILQFGIVFHNYLALTDAVRVGARKGAVSRELPDPKGATVAAVRAAATDLGPGLVVDVTPNAPWAPGGDVKVTGKYQYSVNIIGVVVASGWLMSSTTERIN